MIVKKNKDDLINYLEDTSNLSGLSSLLYVPQNKTELKEAIIKCRDNNMAFTLSAGRTGTTGGCIPFKGAIISIENLNRVLSINKQEKIAKLEAGATLETLESQANQFNLTLAASPTESLATIGGAISTCASGVRGFGYGSIRKYIKEIEVILTNGETLLIKRGEVFARKRHFNFKHNDKVFDFYLPKYNLPPVKTQAGYFVKDGMDLIDLFIGSEGTLGVVLSCAVQLQDRSDSVFDGLIFFKNEADALSFVEIIKEMKNDRIFHPTSLEFFDKNSLNFLKKEYSFIPESESAVYFEQEVSDNGEYDYLFETWQKLLEESRAYLDESIFADTPKLRRKIFEFRHKLPQLINEFLRQNKQVKAATDIAVPDEKFREMYDYYLQKGEESKIKYLNFGHIGESHLHFNFLPQSKKESKRARRYLKEFCQRAVSLGGTVSAEHGIGKLKKPYLNIMFTEEDIKDMARLKRHFDPKCLLGLDNIFNKEILNQI